MDINKEEIGILVELQDLESERARIQSVLVDLPREIESLNEQVEAHANELLEQENAFSEKKKEYRDGESDIQMNLSKIKEKDIKLLSVKDNKTYQILLKEIETLKKKNSAIEDSMLENLEYTEKEEGIISQRRADFEKIKSEIEQEKEEIERKKSLEEKKLTELGEQWEAISQKLRPELLKSFLEVRERTGSVAVAAARRSVCSGCNMNIPPQLFNELHKCDILQLCPHCHRIIYWANNDERLE